MVDAVAGIGHRFNCSLVVVAGGSVRKFEIDGAYPAIPESMSLILQD
jgi:hypothetical protein